MLSRLKTALSDSYIVRLAAWLLILNFSDLLAFLSTRKKKPKGKKTAIFVKLDGIGDYVIWSASFKAIRQIFPDNEFERIVIGNVTWQELAEKEPTFDRGIYLNTPRFASDPLYRYRAMKQIRSVNADVAVNARLTREFLWTDSVIRCSGAAERIGCRGVDNLMNKLQERISDAWYTRLTPHLSGQEHQSTVNIAFLVAAFPDKRFDRSLRLPPRVSSESSPKDNGYAVLVLGAASPERRWPMSRFVEIADLLAQEFGYSIIVCGSRSERVLAMEFSTSFGGKVTDLTGTTSLGDLAAILGRSKLTLTNDTGASHISISMRAPTVVIAPGNHPGRFHPYPEELSADGLRSICIRHTEPCSGCRWNCAHVQTRSELRPCINEITVDEVKQAVRSLCHRSADTAL
jgi:ADP-heptose:LPS heptosyltransferase